MVSLKKEGGSSSSSKNPEKKRADPVEGLWDVMLSVSAHVGVIMGHMQWSLQPHGVIYPHHAAN